MNQRNKNSGFLRLFMVAAMAVALVSGISVGRTSNGASLPLRLFSHYFSSFNNKENTTQQNYIGEDITVDIHPVPENSDEGYETVDIYEKVIPSVVCINVYKSNSVSYSSSGTGIVMTDDGYIITNAHVVDGGNYVNVVFSNGTELRGEIVGSDADTDLAVIKVNSTGLTVAEFGDSSSLRIGERAIVIGNAGGLSGSCTQGIISGLDRKISESRRSLNLIQTNAAINPGNSGGPLVNRFGQIVGITSSKIASVNYEGIGFAIPITEALPIIQSLISNGYVAGRAVLGVQVISLNPVIGPENGLPSHGAYIAEIMADSNLPFRGVRERDVIMKFNDADIYSSDDLLKALTACAPGDMADLEIFRPETGETFTAQVKLIESKN